MTRNHHVSPGDVKQLENLSSYPVLFSLRSSLLAWYRLGLQSAPRISMIRWWHSLGGLVATDSDYGTMSGGVWLRTIRDAGLINPSTTLTDPFADLSSYTPIERAILSIIPITYLPRENLTLDEVSAIRVFTSRGELDIDIDRLNNFLPGQYFTEETFLINSSNITVIRQIIRRMLRYSGQDVGIDQED